MTPAFAPAPWQNLPDGLAWKGKGLIDGGAGGPGDWLPAIAETARRIRVRHPALRGALRKLEAVRIVSVRHGSGVYAAGQRGALFVASPLPGGTPTMKLLPGMNIYGSRRKDQEEHRAILLARADRDAVRARVRMGAPLEGMWNHRPDSEAAALDGPPCRPGREASARARTRR